MRRGWFAGWYSRATGGDGDGSRRADRCCAGARSGAGHACWKLPADRRAVKMWMAAMIRPAWWMAAFLS